jgi:hypothetical protein
MNLENLSLTNPIVYIGFGALVAIIAIYYGYTLARKSRNPDDNPPK